MKKIFLGLIITSFILVGMTGNVGAYSNLFLNAGTIDRSNAGAGNSWDNTFYGFTDADYSGYYLGTFSGNLDETDLETLITKYLGVPFDGTYYKAESPTWAQGPLSVTLNPGGLTGTWTLSGANQIGFYAVKAATETALYYVNPYQSSGTWSTEHLLNNGGNQPAISHLSAFPETAVPEPMTLLLLGLGLVGLAGLRRKF